MTRRVALIATGSVAAIAWTSPAQAETAVALDLPAGTVAQQILALGSTARVSIVVTDPQLWNRHVPALRGRMSARVALRRIAAAAGAGIVDVGANSFRLVLRKRTARPLPRPVRRPSPPPAPPPSDEAGQEIVVTASKRDVPRRDFAGNVSWISGSDLALGGAGGTDRIVDRLTSVASTYLGAGRNKLFIRGLADSSFSGPTQPTVGQYFGDLRLNYNGPDPGLRLIDLAGVEVLEGPQGTLYGAGSLGGVIRLVPNSSGLAGTQGMVEAGASLTARGAPGADMQGFVDLPLVTARLGLRVAGFAETEGGYIDKPLLGRKDANRSRIHGGRATMRADFGRGWSADLTAMGQRIRSADSQYADLDGPPLTNASPVVEGYRAAFAQAQLAVSGRIGEIRLRSTTGATAQGLTERYDATVADLPRRLLVQANRARMIANETRLWRSGKDGTGWLVGISYVHNRARTDRLLGALEAPRPTVAVINRASEATIYGEASARLLPTLLATAGLRVNRTVLTGGLEGSREPDDPDVPGAIDQDAQVGSVRTFVVPTAALLFDLSPELRAFVRYQQGFRPGGLAIADDRLRRFDSDRVDTLEAGVRTAGPGRGPVDFAITLAYTSWQDIQADFLDRGGLPSTANIGTGQIWTLGVTGGFRIDPSLRLAGALSYNDSSIGAPSRDAVAAISNESGLAPGGISARLQKIPNVARLTGRIGAVFERSLAHDSSIKVDGWIRYVGRSTLGIGPVLGQAQGDYIDSSLTARMERGRLGLTVGITNLADARGNRFALGTPITTGRGQITPLRPRTVRFGIDTRF